jgi:hypothetical protein
MKKLLTLAIIGLLSSLTFCSPSERSTPFKPMTDKLFPPCDAPCGYRSEGVTLAQVIDRYGPPPKITAFVLPFGEYNLQVVILFYPHEGLTIAASKRNQLSQLTPDFEVNSVRFWKSRSLSEMALEFQQVKGTWAFELDHAEDWKGFGPIKNILPPPLPITPTPKP